MCKLPPGFKWSFSKLCAWDQCPEMFRLCYIDRVKDDGNAFSDYGTFAHKLLERYAKGELPAFLLADAWESGYDDAVTHPFPPFPRGMPQKYFDAGAKYFAEFDGFGEEWEIVSAEERFEINIGGYPFVGVLDLLLRSKKTGALWVVDHKSKSASSMEKSLATYLRQLYTYAAYIKEKYGVYPQRLSFNMFREGTWIHEDFSQQAFDDTMRWIVETIENILLDSGWKVCPSSYFCRFICSALDACPEREAILNS